LLKGKELQQNTQFAAMKHIAQQYQMGSTNTVQKVSYEIGKFVVSDVGSSTLAHLKDIRNKAVGQGA